MGAFILYVGHIDKMKTVGNLIRAFVSLRDMNDLKVGEGVVQTGLVPDEDVPLL